MRPLACWIGRHEWTSRVEQGEKYEGVREVWNGARRRRRGAGDGREDDPAYTGPAEGGGAEGD